MIRPPPGKTIYKGKILELRKVSIKSGNNDEAIEKEIILHPGAVVILPILDDGEIVLIKNKRLAIGISLWELPAGTLEDNEDPRNCAYRELKEETGYTAEKLYYIGDLFTAGGWSTHRLFVFVAEGLKPGPQHLDSGEKILGSKSFSIEKIFKKIAKGEILDAKTIASIVLYKEKSKSGSERPSEESKLMLKRYEKAENFSE